jgi:hypothetical protein
MSSFFSTIDSTARAARLAADVAVWAGHWTARQYRAGSQGICLLCNNLQPYGHENTFGRTGARWNERESGDNFVRGVNPSNSQTNVATLVLADLSTRKLLEVREINKETGITKRNCTYCRFLCDIFDAFFIDEYMSWVTETHNEMPISFGLMIREGMPLIINCFGFTYEKDVYKPRVDLEVYSENALPLPAIPSGVPKIGPTGPRAAEVRSEFCMGFVEESVRQCCAEHTLCKAQQKENDVPTRLIYLGENDGELCLREHVTSETRVSWAALSHCWGGHQPFKLLVDNIDRLRNGINVSEIPPTFRNAIEVCRRLKISYLWIDSLCIIQENSGDWEIEAARMEMVYSDAFIVICSASSPNPLTPFLGSRDEEWLPKRFVLLTLDGSKTSFSVRRRHLQIAPLEQGIFEPPFTSDWATTRRSGPLYTRGWCFQEMFLAKRILHFSPGAVIYECKIHRRSEDQLSPFPLITPGSLGDVDITEQWRMIVKMYTQRGLTFAKDKLPAIAGAAQGMPQAKFPGSYLAGLWRESLLLDLLWQVMPGSTHIALTYPYTEQKAPSWSWVSVNRAVTWNPLKTPTLLAEVASADTTLAGLNPFGAVTGGRIILRGRVKPCSIQMSYSNNEQWIQYEKPNKTFSEKQHFRADGQLLAQAMPDGTSVVRRARKEEKRPKELATTALFMCIAKTPWVNYNYVGLIMSRSPDEPGCVQRVGNITNLPSDWYEGGQLMTLTLV